MTDFSFSHRIGEKNLSILREYTSQIPVKVGALGNALGLEIVLATLPLNISGLIQPSPNGGFTVKVNRFESKERQRFTIAHEISHYLLHKEKINSGVIDSVLYRSRLSSRTEAEANKLAAEIVMPTSAIFEAISGDDGAISETRVNELAERFGVSKQAMAIRVG